MSAGAAAGEPQDFIEQTVGEDIFLAMVDGKAAGFVSIWRPESFIHFLVVDKTFRRRGVGSDLLQHAVGQLGTPVELKCEAHNRAAQVFYERHGWQIVERIDNAGPPHILYRLNTVCA